MPAIPVLPAILAAAFFLLMGAAVVSDLRHRRIPNALPLLVLGLFLPVVALTPDALLWPQRLLAAGLVLVAGIAVWLTGALGAGDVKLLTAVAWWTGLAELPALVLRMALTGGALALVVLLVHAVRHRRAPGAAIRDTRVPYGVAIAFAAVSLMPAMTPFEELFDALPRPAGVIP